MNHEIGFIQNRCYANFRYHAEIEELFWFQISFCSELLEKVKTLQKTLMGLKSFKKDSFSH